MVDLRIGDEQLVVHLTPWQKVWAFHNDLRLPLTSILRVAPNPDPWLDLRGWRSTGVNFQGRVALGSRRHGGGWDFVVLSRRSPAIDIDLATGRFARLTLAVPDADAAAATVAAAAGIAPGR